MLVHNNIRLWTFTSQSGVCIAQELAYPFNVSVNDTHVVMKIY